MNAGARKAGPRETKPCARRQKQLPALSRSITLRRGASLVIAQTNGLAKEPKVRRRQRQAHGAQNRRRNPRPRARTVATRAARQIADHHFRKPVEELLLSDRSRRRPRPPPPAAARARQRHHLA